MGMLSRFANRLSFAIRSRLQWARGGYAPANEDKDAWLSTHPGLRQRARDLTARYDLHTLTERSTLTEYRESMYVLDLLDRCWQPAPQKSAPLRVLDVGAKNYAYAQGLAAFFGGVAGQQALMLTGIEIDGYPVYRDLHSRFDYAQWHLRGLPHARYLVADVRAHTEQYDVITWFLPFLFADTQAAWGLPDHAFDPAATLTHVASRLAPGGVLVIVNRETEERDEQLALLAAAHLPHTAPRCFDAAWLPVAPRYVTIVTRQ